MEGAAGRMWGRKEWGRKTPGFGRMLLMLFFYRSLSLSFHICEIGLKIPNA